MNMEPRERKDSGKEKESAIREKGRKPVGSVAREEDRFKKEDPDRFQSCPETKCD